MTTETQAPEDWVLLEAAKQANITKLEIDELRCYSLNGRTFRALCDMIAKHEEPPVDRKVLCAREAAVGHYPNHVVENIAVRAIELYEEGFGK